MWTEVSATKNALNMNILPVIVVLLLGLTGASCTSDKRDKPNHVEEEQYFRGKNHSSGDIEYDSFDEEENYQYENGIYCATVDYYNPNTGTSNSYLLNVEVENDELVTVFWPNGGWLDESHFTPEDISSGSCNFISDKGYDYTVTIIGDSCQFTDGDISSEYEEEEDFLDEIESQESDEFADI